MPINAEFELENGGAETIGFIPEPKELFSVERDEAALNINASFNRDPEQEAEILELSKKLDWPVDVVRAKKKEALEEVRKSDFRSINESILLGFIGRSSENAALVKDDIIPLRNTAGFLDRIEKYSSDLISDIEKAYQSGDINLQLAPLYNRKFIQQETDPELDEEIKRLESAILPREEEPDLLKEIATVTAEQIPLVLSAVGSGVARVQEAIPAIGGATIAAGVATGGTGAIPFAIGSAKAIFALGVMEKIAGIETPMAAKEFSEFRDENGEPLDPDVLKYAALTVGYLNGITELVTDVATIGLLKRTPGFKKIFSLAPREAVKEGLQSKVFRTALKRIAISITGSSLINGLEEAVQELTTILGGEAAKKISPGEFEDIDTNKAIKRVLEAGRLGSLGGLGFGLMTGSVSLGTAAVQKGVLINQARNIKKRASSYYDEQVELSEKLDETKTKKRSSDKTKEFLENGGLTKDGFIDGDQALEFYQTGDNSEIFAKLGITEEEIKKAALNGKSIPIKLSEIQSVLSLEESRKFFKTIRESADSLSLDETDTIDIQEELKRIDEALKTIEKDRDEFLVEKSRIETEAESVARIRKIPQSKIYAKGIAEILGNFSLRMSIEGDQSPAATLKRIRTEVSTFKDLADAEKFLKENGLKNSIPLGVTRIVSEGFIIKLFEGANHSTLIHETGHVFLGEIESIVSNGHASENLINDYDLIKKWLGVVPEQEITIEQQDRFAQAFELYVREGKAPNKNLIPFFERFKKWLTTIYKKIKGSAIDVGLTDEVRLVFDRLLMVEEQTERFVEENELFISDAVLDSLNLKDAQKLEFRRRLSGASKIANQSIQLDLARDYKANIKKWTAEAKIKVAGKRVNNLYADLVSSKRGFNLAASSEFLSAKELNELELKKPDTFSDDGIDPKIIAERFGYASVKAMFTDLRTQPSLKSEIERIDSLRYFLDHPVMGLNESEIEFQFGKQVAIRLKAKNSRLVRKNGQNPSIIAMEYGYESMDDMIKELERRSSRQDQILEIISRKEKEHYLNFTANDFFLNEKNKGLEQSLEMLGSFLKARAGVEVDMPAKQYRNIVNQSFAALTVRRASNTNWHLSDMRRALRNRDKEIKKGDFRKALKFHEQARLSYEFARKSNQIRKAQDNLRTLVKKSRSSKGKIDFDYWKNIISLGNKYGLGKGKEPQQIVSFQNLLKAQASLLDPGVEFRSWIENDPPKNFLDLLVNQFEELDILFKVLNHVGRKIRSDETVLSDMKFSELKEKLIIAASELKDKVDWTNIPPMQKVDNAIKEGFAYLDTAYNIARTLDDYVQLRTGKPGPWEKSFPLNLFRANSEQLRIGHVLEEKQINAFRQLARSAAKYPNVITDTGVEVPENMRIARRGWTFETIISLALNMGNRANIEAVKEGFGLSESDLNKFWKYLTDKDWDAIIDLAKTINLFQPKLFSTARKIQGFEPSKVEGDPFTLPSGRVIEGWYYPLRMDRTLNKLGSNEKVPGDISAEQNFTDVQNAAINTGALIERKGFGRNPVKLDLNVFSQHLKFVELYISHAEIIKDLSRLLKDNDIRKTIDLKIGRPSLNTLETILSFIANDGNEKLTIVDRFSEKIRGASAASILTASVTVPLKQPYSIFRFTQREGKRTFVKGTFDLILKTIKFNPITMTKLVFDLSPYMKERNRFMGSMDISMQEAIQRKLLARDIKGVTLEHVRAATWIFIKTFDFITVMPSWWSAYLKGQELYKGSKTQIAEAVSYADDAIRTTQPSREKIDLSPMQLTKKSVGRALTFFSTFTISNEGDFRLWGRAFRQGKISPYKYVKFLAETALVPSLLMTTMLGALKDEFPELRDYIFDLLMFRAGGYPGAREIAFGVKNKIQGKSFFSKIDTPLFLPLNLGVEVLGGFYMALEDDDKVDDAIWAMAHLSSFFLRIPASKYAERAVKAVRNYDRGYRDPLSLLGQTPSKK